MRPTRVASVLLVPVLLAATAFASSPKADAPSNSQTRVTTGVVGPAIVDINQIRVPASAFGHTAATSARVVVALTVDEKGNAQNVHIVQSASRDLDARVVGQVQQSHFRPATLDNRNIPMAMNLIVDINR